MKKIKSFFLLFSIFFSFSFAYADCHSLSNFTQAISFIYEKSGYKVFKIYDSLYYVVDSEIVQSSTLTCGVVSGGEHFLVANSVFNITGSATYQPSKEKSIPANTVSYSRYYPYNCSADQVLNLKTKKCQTCPKDHFLNQETGQCEPEIKRPDWCPEPMIYNERKVELLLRDKIVEECLPDPSISESDCKKRNMKFHGCDDSVSGYELATCMSIPSGCYAPETIERFKAEKQLDNDLFIIGGFMIPLPINAFKNGFSSLGSFFKGLFSGGAKPTNLNLLEYRPPNS